MPRRNRILWTTNIVLPDVASELGLAPQQHGGWMAVMLRQLSEDTGLHFGVAMKAPIPSARLVKHSGINYYALPQTGIQGVNVSPRECRAVLTDFAPDILHAQGSEMPFVEHFMSTMRVESPKLVSLQGVASGIEPHLLGGLSFRNVSAFNRPMRALTLAALHANREVVFRRRVAAERRILNLATDVIGRTRWDQSQLESINPRARYHHIDESLRAPFFDRRWTEGAAKPQRIFLASAAAPLKGAHLVLSAVAQLRARFPAIEIVIAGVEPSSTGAGWRRAVSYSSLFKSLVRDAGLTEIVRYAGLLNADEMAEEMKKANVFVLSSLIENSPNSLCEAMAVGTPTVAAYAGGIPSLMRDEEEGLLFRAGDSAMMAHQIGRLFDDGALANRLSAAARLRAAERHNTRGNGSRLQAVYEQLLAGQ